MEQCGGRKTPLTPAAATVAIVKKTVSREVASLVVAGAPPELMTPTARVRTPRTSVTALAASQHASVAALAASVAPLKAELASLLWEHREELFVTQHRKSKVPSAQRPLGSCRRRRDDTESHRHGCHCLRF